MVLPANSSSLGQAQGHAGRGAARDAAQDAFLAPQTAGDSRWLPRRWIARCDPRRSDPACRVRNRRRCPESCARAGLSGWPLRKLVRTGTLGGFDGHRGDGLLLGFLDVARDSGDGASYPRPKPARRWLVGVLPDLGPSGLFVNTEIGGFLNAGQGSSDQARRRPRPRRDGCPGMPSGPGSGPGWRQRRPARAVAHRLMVSGMVRVSL